MILIKHRDHTFKRAYSNPENPLVELQGKRVALVGGSPMLVGSKLGKEIDECDVVVRINCHWPCPLRYLPQIDARRDLGERTDILFHNGSTGGTREDVMKLQGLRKVIFTGNGLMYRGATNRFSFMRPRIIKWAKSSGVETYQYNWYWLKLKSSTIVGISLTAGMSAMLAIIEEPIKELFLAGFDFYSSNYKPDREILSYTTHNPYKEKIYFRQNIMNDERVVMSGHVFESLQPNNKVHKRRSKRLNEIYIACQNEQQSSSG